MSAPALLLALLAAVLPAAAEMVGPARPVEAAAFQFALGKVLAAEGSFPEALAAFEEAEKLSPRDPYVRLERAELLGRLGSIARQPKSRADYLGRAVEEVSKARELAPGNPDVLRALGEIYLALSEQDPKALAIAQEAYEALRRGNPGDLQVMVTLGRIYLEEGQAARAAEVFRELVSYTPNNEVVSTLLVESLLKADRKQEAEGVLREMLTWNPESLQTRLTLAEVEGQRGDHRAALDTLLAAPEGVRGDPQLRRQLASTLYLNGDLDSALKTADELLKAQPDNQYLELLKGLVLTAQGRNTEALTLLTRLRETDPQDLVLAATLARVLRREGRKDEAAKLLGDLAASLAKDGKVKESRAATLELAQLYATTEDWQKESEAVEPLLRPAAPPATATDTADTDAPAVRTEALLLKADALLELKRYDEALNVLVPPSSSAPAPAPVIAAKRGEVLWKSGKEREAQRQLSRLARSEDPQVLLAVAQSYQRLEQYGESVPLLAKVLSGHPDLPAAGFMLGAAYERTGKHELAVTAFRKVLKADPDFHAALNYLGYMWAEKGENLPEALSMIRRAVALDPDNGAYVDSLGWTHYRLGQYDRARDYLERATRLVPEDATVHEHLGDVYIALGQRDKAREMYRRALALADHSARTAHTAQETEQVRHKLDGLDSTPRR
ncbi:MAG TPA: tetratricopeptide repeat protein [Thermoanaerobaculia bacterium]|nr:tetratricopeptide repeat protein [Thermoanaerobaculia bacterium]